MRFFTKLGPQIRLSPVPNFGVNNVIVCLSYPTLIGHIHLNK
jgi:hypothetical protein